MGERTSHAPGTFSWVDLATSDGDGAKAFYSELFGWESEDMPGEAGTYTMFRLDGRDIAGCFEQPNEGGSSIPPHWNSYVTVEDVDASVSMAAELGGSVWLVNAPGALCWNDLGTTDVDAARAFFGALFGWTFEDPSDADPQGAAFGVFEGELDP